MMNKEKLSQLLDDELDANESEAIIDSLLDNPELQRAWLAHYTARAALRDKAVHASLDMADRVAEALENEAPIIAPQNLPDTRMAQAPVGEKVVPLQARRKRVLAFAAMAASVAALVFISYTPERASTPPIAETAPQPPQNQALENEMQSMIVQHGEFSGATALNGLVAYAKVVNGSTRAADR